MMVNVVNNKPLSRLNGSSILNREFSAKLPKGRGKKGCWNWSGTIKADGYGAFTWDGKSMLAHRVSWEVHTGNTPGNLHVCHSCDNRKCVNPRHLWLGTNADNMADRGKKGRQAKGEKSGKAKLTAADVKKILTDTRSASVLEKEFPISHWMIRGIRRGKSWRHISIPFLEKMVVYDRH